MVKKIIFVLIGCIACWWFFSPVSLQDQLYSSIKAKCKNQEKCIVRLHEITSFKWDKAYFFSPESPYSFNIDKVVGTLIKLKQQGKEDALVVFIRNGKIVQEEIFEIINSDYYELRLPPLLQFFTRESVGINFVFRKSRLKELNYSGNIDDFVDLVGVEYYEITPQNDLLRAGCETFYLRATASKIEEKQCGLGFTNLNQVVLFNPKTHKEVRQQ